MFRPAYPGATGKEEDGMSWILWTVIIIIALVMGALLKASGLRDYLAQQALEDDKRDR